MEGTQRIVGGEDSTVFIINWTEYILFKRLKALHGCLSISGNHFFDPEGPSENGHIGRAVRFVDFIARFSTDIVYFTYRSSHLSLPIFVTDKSCL